jgi:hypothetical protein
MYLIQYQKNENVYVRETKYQLSKDINELGCDNYIKQLTNQPINYMKRTLSRNPDSFSVI